MKAGRFVVEAGIDYANCCGNIHSCFLSTYLAGAFSADEPDSKWGHVVGNLLSEWVQMAGLVFFPEGLGRDWIEGVTLKRGSEDPQSCHGRSASKTKSEERQARWQS